MAVNLESLRDHDGRQGSQGSFHNTIKIFLWILIMHRSHNKRLGGLLLTWIGFNPIVDK